VVSKCDHVGARGEEPVGEPRRQPGAVGRVLTVRDAEVCVELVAESGQSVLDRPTPRCAEDVGDEQNLQGSESVAAG
jgi:hypothetical protein